MPKYWFFYLLCSVFIVLNPPLVSAQSDTEVVAVVNGRKITQREVDDSIIGKLLPLQEQIDILRKVALDNLIIQELLQDEAKKQGISVEELRKALTVGKVEVPLSDVEKEYLENSSAFAAMSPDEAKERVRLNLESQARIKLYREALKTVREQARIEIKSNNFLAPKLLINDDGPVIGNSRAKVTIVMFADFQCPYCRQFSATGKQLLQAHKDNIRLIFKYFPLTANSFSAARASVCAGQQGRFWEYHDVLFAAEDFSGNQLQKFAEKLGLNLPAFNSCFSSEASRLSILKDMREAKRLGVEGTPAFFVNGNFIRGNIGLEDFNKIIERELKGK